MKAALEHPIGPFRRSSNEHGHVKFLVDQQFGQTYLEKNIFFKKSLKTPQTLFQILISRHEMVLGTFRDIFGFPIGGKKISKIIFLVDFSRRSKWQLLGTRKYPEMFLMTFYATGPFESKQNKENRK